MPLSLFEESGKFKPVCLILKGGGSQSAWGLVKTEASQPCQRNRKRSLFECSL